MTKHSINGYLVHIAMGLATAGIIGAIAVYAQVQVIEADESRHEGKDMHTGARKAVDQIRRDIAEVDKKAALNEAYLEAIADKVGAKVIKP